MGLAAAWCHPPGVLTSASELALCLPTAQSGAPEDDRPGCSTLPLGPDFRIGPSTGMPAAQWVLKWMKSRTAAFRCPHMGADQQIRMGPEAARSSSWIASCFCLPLGAEKQNGASSGPSWSSTEHRCNLQYLQAKLQHSAVHPWVVKSRMVWETGLPVASTGRMWSSSGWNMGMMHSAVHPEELKSRLEQAPVLPTAQWWPPVDEKLCFCTVVCTCGCWSVDWNWPWGCLQHSVELQRMKGGGYSTMLSGQAANNGVSPWVLISGLEPAPVVCEAQWGPTVNGKTRLLHPGVHHWMLISWLNAPPGCLHLQQVEWGSPVDYRPG